MPIPARLANLRLPLVAAPMFIASGPDLVVETCRAGVAGTFPSLNGRTTAQFVDWLAEISARLLPCPGAAPFGVNLIVHRSNTRLDQDLAAVVAHRVPLVITSLGAVSEIVQAVQSYGGLVFHDVINLRHAVKAAEAGVDGIVAVSAGAGGHAGTLHPFALVQEIRAVFDGTILMSGAISTGAQIAAARMAGADLAYAGTRFIATKEAAAPDAHKAMIMDARASDIIYTQAISGVNANFLRPSIAAAGLNPDALPQWEGGHRAHEDRPKAWKNIWSAGQGVAACRDIPAVAELCDTLAREYEAAIAAMAADPFRNRQSPCPSHDTRVQTAVGSQA